VETHDEQFYNTSRDPLAFIDLGLNKQAFTAKLSLMTLGNCPMLGC